MNPTEKIRRLLRLGKSSNRHEAESALAFAAKLARKYSIDIGSVKQEEERARIIEEKFESRIAFDQVHGCAARVCISLFSIEVIQNYTHATFIGLEHNVAAARFAYDFIIEQCARDLGAYRQAVQKSRRKRMTEVARRDFCSYWALAVIAKHAREDAAAESGSNAIVLSGQKIELQKYMGEKHGDIPEAKPPKMRKRDLDAATEGMKAGQKVSVRRPVESTQSEFLALAK